MSSEVKENNLEQREEPVHIKLLSHGFAYILFSGLSKVAAFLVLPIVTRYLSVEEYGIYSNLIAAQNILYGFASLGVDAAYGRYLYIYNSPRKLRLLTSTIIVFLLVWSILFFGVSYYTISIMMDSWSYQNERYTIYIAILLPLIILSKQYASLNVFLMQSRHQTKDIISINTVAVIAIQVFILIFMITLGMNLLSMFLSQALVYFFVLLVHLKRMTDENLVDILCFSKKVLLKNIRYGLGYLPSIWGLWIFTSSDRFIITYLASAEATGKFSFLSQFGMLIMMVVQSISVVYWPIYLNLMKLNDGNVNDEKLSAFIGLSMYVMLLLFICISVFSPILIEYLFVGDYKGDYFVLYMISLGAFFLGVRKIYALTLGFYKKVAWLSYSAYVPAVLNVILNVLLIPEYGIYGAAFATLVSVVIYATIVYLMSQRLHKLEINTMQNYGLGALAILLVWAADGQYSVMIGFSAILFYLYIGWLLGIHKLPNKL